MRLDVDLVWQLGAAFFVARLDPEELGDTPPQTDDELTATWQASMVDGDYLDETLGREPDAEIGGCSVAGGSAAAGGELFGLIGIALTIAAGRRRHRR